MKIVNTYRLQLITLINFAARLGFIYDASTKTFIGFKNRVSFNKMVAFFNNPHQPYTNKMLVFRELASKINQMHGSSHLNEVHGLSVVQATLREAPIERIALVYSKKRGEIMCNSHIVKIRNQVTAQKYMRLLNMNFDNFREENNG